MPNYSKYQWSVKGVGTVKHGGKVAGVSIDTSLLDAMTNEIEEIASDIILDIGNETVTEVVRNAPEDTGELKDSYLSESELISKLTFRIQDGVPYGIFNELGTSRMAARPHVIPAVEEAEEKIILAFKELFK